MDFVECHEAMKYYGVGDENNIILGRLYMFQCFLRYRYINNIIISLRSLFAVLGEKKVGPWTTVLEVP